MTAKKRRVRTRKNSLSAYYSKRERDLMFCYPTSAADGHYLYSVFGGKRYDYNGKEQPSFAEELAKRGYDISTLRFSILKKEDHSRWQKPTEDGETPRTNPDVLTKEPT